MWIYIIYIMFGWLEGLIWYYFCADLKSFTISLIDIVRGLVCVATFGSASIYMNVYIWRYLAVEMMYND